MNPRSPAKPQHCTASHVTTAALQRPAIAISLSTLPILRTLQTGWTATGRALRRDLEARQQRVVDELDAVVDRQRPRQHLLHAVRARAGVEDDRPAAVLARLAQRRGELGRLQVGGVDEPLAFERLAAAQAVERSRDRRRRSRRAGTAARRPSAASRLRRGHAGDPCCARRSSGNRRSARRRRRRRGAARSAPAGPASATISAAVRPTPCAARRGCAFIGGVPTHAVQQVGGAEPESNAGGDAAVVARRDRRRRAWRAGPHGARARP